MIYCCSVAKLCLTPCNPMDCSMLGFPVLHYLLEFARTPLPANAGDIGGTGSILGLRRSSRGEPGNPLLYSCLEDPMDREAWQATVYRVAKSQTCLKQLNTHMSTELVMPSNHLILCCLLLLLPSVFPSIRVFYNELTLHIRWPKYWSVSISPSGEFSGLISFRIDYNL